MMMLTTAIMMDDSPQSITSIFADALFPLAALAPLIESRSTLVGACVGEGIKATSMVGLGVGGDGTVVASTDVEGSSVMGSVGRDEGEGFVAGDGVVATGWLGVSVGSEVTGGSVTVDVAGCGVVVVVDDGDRVGEATGFVEGDAGVVVEGAVMDESQHSREMPLESGQHSPSNPAQSGCAAQLARFKGVGAAVFPARLTSNNEKSKVSPSSQVKTKSLK